jgi:hypothetical protein
MQAKQQYQGTDTFCPFLFPDAKMKMKDNVAWCKPLVNKLAAHP